MQGVAILVEVPGHGSIHFADLGFHLVVVRWSAGHGDMRDVTPASMCAERTNEADGADIDATPTETQKLRLDKTGEESL